MNLTPEKLTKGGWKGHLLRRSVHLCSLFIPYLYYFYGYFIAEQELGIHLQHLIIGLLLFIIFFEILRVAFGWTIFGQRAHEVRHISSFTWAAIAVVSVLLFAPGPQYGIPIIWGWALGDPLLGELRRLPWHKIWIVIIGIIFLALVWLLCTLLFHTPWWLALIMAPITVLAEWPNLAWLDDNATMQWIPLIIILILHYLRLL